MTINGLGPSVSALNAFGTKMASSAENIANSQSAAYKKSRVVLTNQEPGGTVKADVSRDNSPGVQTADGEELSNVDLAEELVSTIPTSYGFKASVQTIKTMDDMSGTIIDIKG